MATHITIVNQVSQHAGWHFRRYHRRFHRAWYWLTGTFLLEMGFWLGIAGLAISLEFLALLITVAYRIGQNMRHPNAR